MSDWVYKSLFYLVIVTAACCPVYLGACRENPSSVASVEAEISAMGNGWERFSGASESMTGYSYTFARLEVPGGWLVYRMGGGSTAPVFVPDPEHEWELAE